MKRRKFLQGLVGGAAVAAVGVKACPPTLPKPEEIDLPPVIDYGRCGILMLTVIGREFKLLITEPQVDIKVGGWELTERTYPMLGGGWLECPPEGAVPDPAFMVPVNEKTVVHLEFKDGNRTEFKPEWDEGAGRFKPVLYMGLVTSPKSPATGNMFFDPVTGRTEIT